MQPQPYHGPTTEAPDQRARAGFFRAGQVAIWVWLVLALLPVLLVIACCGLCGVGGIGALIVTPSPSPSGY